MGNGRGIGALVVSGLVGLAVLGAVWGCFYSVDQRERAVVLRNGAIVGEADPGLHFKLPFIDDVVEISTQSHRVEMDNMEAYSRDQQPAKLRISVLYSVQPSRVREVYSRFTGAKGLEDRVIAPKVYEQTKNVFGQFDAVTAVQDRVRLNSEIARAIHDAIGGLNAPVTVEAVQIENIEFSPEYMRSIEQRMQAAVEVDRLRQNALREQVQAQIVVTQAGAQAEAAKAKAEAEATAIRLRGEAEAATTRVRGEAEAANTRLRGDAEAGAIRAKGEALAGNPGLVPLIQAERWNGQLPTTMVPGGGVPLLSLGQR